MSNHFRGYTLTWTATVEQIVSSGFYYLTCYTNNTKWMATHTWDFIDTFSVRADSPEGVWYRL